MLRLVHVLNFRSRPRVDHDGSKETARSKRTCPIYRNWWTNLFIISVRWRYGRGIIQLLLIATSPIVGVDVKIVSCHSDFSVVPIITRLLLPFLDSLPRLVWLYDEKLPDSELYFPCKDLARSLHSRDSFEDSFWDPCKNPTWKLVFPRTLDGIQNFPWNFLQRRCSIFEAPSIILEHPWKEFNFVNLGTQNGCFEWQFTDTVFSGSYQSRLIKISSHL